MKSVDMGFSRAARKESRFKRSRITRVLTSALAAVLALGGTALAATPASAAEDNLRILNSFRYVSDQGTATFLPAIQKGGKVTFDGNMRFFTSPGAAGTAIGWNGAATDKATSLNGPATLPAYAADGSTEPIGTWALPQGIIASTSPDRAITLQLNPDKLDYAGVIRPLRVAINDPGDLMQCLVFASDCIGTMFPLSLASTLDAPVVLADINGTADLNYRQGSCINGTNGVGNNGSKAELTMNVCQDGVEVTLLDATGTPQGSLPMTDDSGAPVGIWAVAADKKSITWELDVTVDQVGNVSPVSYQVQDLRNESWSGWWDQSIVNNSESAPQTTTYETALLVPEFEASTDAAAADAAATTVPNEAATLTPAVSAGSFRGTPSTITDMAVTPVDAALGTWVVAADHTVRFTPSAGTQDATAEAEYSITSSNGTTASARLSASVSKAATAVDADASTAAATPHSFPATIYSAGTLADSSAATAQVTITPTDAKLGEWVAEADGSLSFTPSPAAAGKQATAQYSVVSSNSTTASAQLSVSVAQAPVASLSLEMTADGQGITIPAKPTQPIVYAYTVTNTGAFDLTELELSNALSSVDPVTYQWPGAPGSLKVGESLTASGSYAISAADITAGSVTNSVTARASSLNNDVVATAPDVVVALTAPAPAPPKKPEAPKPVTPELPKTGAPTEDLWGAAGVALAAIAIGGTLLLRRGRQSSTR